MLAALNAAWTKSPGLRLGQLIVNAANKSGVKVVAPELFYIDDDRLIHGLNSLHAESDSPPPPLDSALTLARERFITGVPIDGIPFAHNQNVVVVSGRHKGTSGFLISIEAIQPETKFLLENMMGRDIVVGLSEIEAVSS